MRGFGSLRRRHDVHHTSHTRWHYLAQLNPSVVMPKTLNIYSGDDGKRLEVNTIKPTRSGRRSGNQRQ